MALAKAFQNHNERSIRLDKKLPCKRSINLATVGVQKFRFSLAVPGIILILLLAALFSKFAVYDRLEAAAKAEADANRSYATLQKVYQSIEELGDLNSEYAHYTYSDFTDEELLRADRTESLRLLTQIITPVSTLSRYQISNNQMTVQISQLKLSGVNQLVADLEEESSVDYCTITTAQTLDGTALTQDSLVTAQLVIYMNGNSVYQ